MDHVNVQTTSIPNDHIDILDVFASAGELSDSIEQITCNEDGSLSVFTQENAFLLHANGRRIVLEALIDADIGKNREQVMTALLTYNFLWQDTGSIRMSLSGGGRDAAAIMIADIILDSNFCAEHVASVIEDMDAKILVWRNIIAQGAYAGSEMMRSQNTFVRV